MSKKNISLLLKYILLPLLLKLLLKIIKFHCHVIVITKLSWIIIKSKAKLMKITLALRLWETKEYFPFYVKSHSILHNLERMDIKRKECLYAFILFLWYFC